MVLECLSVTRRKDLPGGYCFIPPLLPGTESQPMAPNYIAVYDGRQKRQAYVLIFVMYDVFAAGEGSEGRLERC